jgi:hypothetical protein
MTHYPYRRCLFSSFLTVPHCLLGDAAPDLQFAAACDLTFGEDVTDAANDIVLATWLLEATARQERTCVLLFGEAEPRLGEQPLDATREPPAPPSGLRGGKFSEPVDLEQ